MLGQKSNLDLSVNKVFWLLNGTGVVNATVCAPHWLSSTGYGSLLYQTQYLSDNLGGRYPREPTYIGRTVNVTCSARMRQFVSQCCNSSINNLGLTWHALSRQSPFKISLYKFHLVRR